jgi:hypothetical protein
LGGVSLQAVAVFAQGLQVSGVVVFVVVVNMVHVQLAGVERDKPTPLTLVFFMLAVVEFGDMQLL